MEWIRLICCSSNKNPANTDVYWVCTQLVAESKGGGSRRLNIRKIGGYWTDQIPRTTLWTTLYTLAYIEPFYIDKRLSTIALHHSGIYSAQSIHCPPANDATLTKDRELSYILTCSHIGISSSKFSMDS